jgi:hypothetical protein
MIKFFRKIRQNLLMANKTGKYFKYAIGEIVLVVIGILIALSINNWNELQKTKSWEERFLIDLQNELKNDYTQLTEVYTKQTKKGNNFREVLDLIPKSVQADKTKIDSIYKSARTGNQTFFPTAGVYNSAMSAGKIENIKNDSLKYAITNLYNRYYSRLIYNGEVLDDVVEKIDWESRNYFNKSQGIITSWEVIKDNEFITQTEFLIAQNKVYTRIAKNNLDRIDAIIKMISKELK